MFQSIIRTVTQKQREARIKIRLESSPETAFFRKCLFSRNHAYRNNVRQRATPNRRRELENSIKIKKCNVNGFALDKTTRCEGTSINIKHRTNIHWQRHTERTVLLKNLKS